MNALKKFCLVAGGILISSGGAEALQAQGTTQQNQQAQANQQAQGINAQGGFNGGISQSPWFSNPTIRQQLELNDEQFNNLNNVYMQSFNRYNQSVTGLEKNLTESQRAQRLQELNHGFSNDFSKSADELFANDAARQRFNQYRWQHQGYGAFSNPNIQKQLNLTDVQLQAFNKYNTEWNNQMGIWHREYPSNRNTTSNSFREARREAHNRINSTLSPDQRRMWNDMIGKPIDWPADAYFPNPVTSDSK